MKIVLVVFVFLSLLLQAENIPLVFDGNDKLSNKELYAALNLSEASFYELHKEDPSINVKIIPFVEQTIINYYRTKGFYHAEVHTTQNQEEIKLHIEEKNPVRISAIEIDSLLPLESELPFEEGDLFDADMFTKSKKNIELFYAKKSYCNAKLTAKAYVDTELDSAKLLYKIVPNESCRFGKITITPSKSIDEEIIGSLLYIKEDEPFSLENISKSYKYIYEHPGISSALINTKVAESAIVDVNVSVVENENPIRFETALGYSSDQGFMVSLGVEDRNFFGNLKTLGISTKVTEIYQNVKVNYSMPLKHRDTFGAELAVKNEKYLGFKELSTSGTLFLEQRYTPHSFKENLVFDNTYTYDSADLALFPNGNLFILSPKLGWGYDTRNNILDPTDGYFINADVMGSLLSALSDASYTKLTLSGGYILPLIGSNYLATKASFGTLNLYDGDIPPSYRFFAGGTYSNRAYSYRDLGPKDIQGNPSGFDSLLEVTFEYRFPIYAQLRGVLFSDNTAIGSSYLPDTDNFYYSAGFGLRYKTPIGPIALDFGFDLANPRKQYAINFHIGELF